MYITRTDSDSLIVIADNNRISAYLIELAIRNRTILCSFKKNGPISVDSPVTSKQRLFVLHKGAGRMRKFQSVNMHVADRGFLGAGQMNQVFQQYNFYYGIVHISTLLGHIMQYTFLCIEIPLARHVQFLKNILNHSVNRMHLGRSVVLPSANHSQRAILLLACNQPMHISPKSLVHGMKISSLRILPAICTCLA